MRRTANVRVGELAGFCTDPEEAATLMREAIKWGIQQSRRTARMIKLERLLRGGVGTSRAERLGIRLAEEARGGRRGPNEERMMARMVKRKVMLLMRDKLADAEEDTRLAKIQFHKAKKKLWMVVPWASWVGAGVREVIRGEMALEWEEKMNHMARTVSFLINKFRRGRVEEGPGGGGAGHLEGREGE